MNTIIETPTIVQTEEGLEISNSYTWLYQIVDLLKKEWPASLVRLRFELTEKQMDDILAYIDLHPEEVEADYIFGRRRAEERHSAWQEKRANGESTLIEEKWPTWWPADTIPGVVIHIIETDSGPMISNSRSSVYDVMEAYDEGDLPREIAQTYNLSPHQVKVALEYIQEYREILEPELKEVVARREERERMSHAYLAELTKWRMETNPPEMTPRRRAFMALLEKSRRARGEL